jgi:hypothetical protein
MWKNLKNLTPEFLKFRENPFRRSSVASEK